MHKGRNLFNDSSFYSPAAGPHCGDAGVGVGARVEVEPGIGVGVAERAGDAQAVSSKATKESIKAKRESVSIAPIIAESRYVNGM